MLYYKCLFRGTFFILQIAPDFFRVFFSAVIMDLFINCGYNGKTNLPQMTYFSFWGHFWDISFKLMLFHQLILLLFGSYITVFYRVYVYFDSI